MGSKFPQPEGSPALIAHHGHLALVGDVHRPQIEDGTCIRGNCILGTFKGLGNSVHAQIGGSQVGMAVAVLCALHGAGHALSILESHGVAGLLVLVSHRVAPAKQGGVKCTRGVRLYCARSPG